MVQKKFLTHLNEKGRAWMVDVSKKQDTQRVAIAEGEVFMKPETLLFIKDKKMAKGDVLAIAQVAGIMAAKETSRMIPLCHPLIIHHVDLDFYFMNDRNSILIRSFVMTTGKTGVEIEALHAVSVAALTVYDMCKAVDRGMEISRIHLVEKDGGQSGQYHGRSYLNHGKEEQLSWKEENIEVEKGTVLSVCIGESRERPKKPVPRAVFIQNYGIKGDVHAGRDHKQVSLLSLESLEKNRKQGYELNYGDLFENIDFQGIKNLYRYPVGTIIKIGQEVILRITQIGKDHDVDILVRGHKVRSIMPVEGIFTCVIQGGIVCPGDTIEVIQNE